MGVQAEQVRHGETGFLGHDLRPGLAGIEFKQRVGRMHSLADLDHDAINDPRQLSPDGNILGRRLDQPRSSDSIQVRRHRRSNRRRRRRLTLPSADVVDSKGQHGQCEDGEEELLEHGVER